MRDLRPCLGLVRLDVMSEERTTGWGGRVTVENAVPDMTLLGWAAAD
jgi:hypothetical protein